LYDRLANSGGTSGWLRGVIAPMFTPFLPDGTLDLEGAAALVDYLAGCGYVDGVFVRSGLGQMYTFTADEVLALARVAVNAANGRVPILVGAGGVWDRNDQHRPDPRKYVQESIDLAAKVVHMGAAAAVLPVPLALPPADMRQYYAAVAAGAKVPIVAYQPPGVPPEYRLSPIDVAHLAATFAIHGLKLSTDSEELFAPIANAVRDLPFSLIAGNEAYYLRALELGAVGVIGQGCNLYPEVLQAVRRLWLCGDREGAVRAQAAVWDALRATDGLDVAVLGKQIFAARGVKLQPYSRGGATPYPQEVVSRAAAAIDRCAAPYRAAEPSTRQ